MIKYIITILLSVSLVTSCNTNENINDSVLKPLNIVYIMADDHAYQAISAYGSDVSKLAQLQILIELLLKGSDEFCFVQFNLWS